jgi:hypothetical protein
LNIDVSSCCGWEASGHPGSNQLGKSRRNGLDAMHDRDSIRPVHRVSGAMPVPTAGTGT